MPAVCRQVHLCPPLQQSEWGLLCRTGDCPIVHRAWPEADCCLGICLWDEEPNLVIETMLSHTGSSGNRPEGRCSPMLAPPGLVWKIPDVLGSPYTLLNSEVKKLQGPRPHSIPGQYLPLILNGLGLGLPWTCPLQLLPTAQRWDKVTSVVAVLRGRWIFVSALFSLDRILS